MANLAPAAAGIALACLPQFAHAADAAAAADMVHVPLPSSALMGLLLLSTIGAFARFPSSRQRRRLRRKNMRRN